MIRIISGFFVIAILLSSIFIPVVSANSTTTNVSGCPVSKKGEMRVIKSPRGICVKTNIGNSTFRISIVNPLTRYLQNAGYVIYVNSVRYQREFFNLRPGEKISKNLDIVDGLNTIRDTHTVTISTVGNYTTYNFTKKINASSTDEIPTPYIANVTVGDGIIDGKPSAVAYVTLVNPSMRRYSTKLFVHTIGTDGSFYALSPQPHNSTTVKVELLDKRGTKVAGEVRLYTGNLTDKSSGLDQVGFTGKSGGKTKQWNESFQPVRPTWMNNDYHYTNDTYSQSFGEKLSGNREINGIPVVYLALSLLVGLLFVRRWR